VPACQTCHNDETSKDDEYFRLILHLREDLSGHPEVVKMREIIKRSLKKPEKFRLLKGLYETFQMADSVTPAGIIVGRQLAFKADMNRLRRVVKRMVKGFFFHETGRRVPDEYDILAASEDTVRNWPTKVQTEIVEGFVKPLLAQAPVVLGNSVFSYQAAFDRNDMNASAWMFTFYDRARFLGLTLPPVRLADGKALGL